MSTKADKPKKHLAKRKTQIPAEIKIIDDLMQTTEDNKQPPSLTLPGLVDAKDSFTEDSKRVLEFLLTDAVNDDIDRDPHVTRAIKRACQRAQMSGKRSDEVTFFRHVSDPGFMKVVKETGSALVGSHILELVATLLNIAIEDRKQWAMTACLKIAGLLPTQYDIYQLKYENTHIQNFSGEVNYGEKSDQELEGIIAEVYDEREEEEACG
jgi:hypothetical protein